MRKLYFLLTLLLGITGITSAQAETVVVPTATGDPVTSLADLNDGDVVMLYNTGRTRFADNHAYSDGTFKSVLDYDLELGSIDCRGFLWRLVKTDGENTYRIQSLSDGNYMTCTWGAAPRTCTTTEEVEESETFTISAFDEAAGLFLIKANRASENEGQDLFLNGQGGSSSNNLLVVYPGTAANGQYLIYKPTTLNKELHTITYSFTFYDGESQTTLDDAGLSALIPSAVGEERTMTATAAVGDTVTFPAFSHMSLRTAMKGDELVSDSASFVLDEDDLTDGALSLALSYTSDPQISFVCTMDLSAINGADGEYVFPESGATSEVRTVRYAVGDTIMPPAIENFTVLTDLGNSVASTSKEIAVTYRPWRQLTVTCGVLQSGDVLTSIRNMSVYVDVDSTLVAPDLGSLYTFDAEATAEHSNLTLPLLITTDNIYNGMQLELVYTYTVPFELGEINADGTLNQETATWYVVRVHGNKVLTDQVDDDNMLILDPDAPIDDHTLWAIAQANDGSGAFLLFNKANPDKVLCDNGGGLTYPELIPAAGGEIGFDLVNVNENYGLRVSSYYIDNENALMNDLSNAGHLGYWNNSAAWTGVGSEITFEKYDIRNYSFLTGRAYLNAQDCIGGFTAEQLENVRNLVEAGDLSMESEVEYICNDELRYAEERVPYVEGDVYAIISAAKQYIQRDNVQMGLYVGEDSVLAWKEFDPTDNRFFFQLRDRETLPATSGQDSVVFALYNIGANGYLWGNFSYGSEVKLDSVYHIETDRFHAAPVEERTDAESGDVLRSYVPAGFYIQRLRPGTWGDSMSAPIIVTFCMHSGAVDATTAGKVTSYNTHEDAYANVFRFKHIGTAEEVGIGSVTTDAEAVGDGKLYDLSGRQLQHEPEQGVFIKNGKAVLK